MSIVLTPAGQGTQLYTLVHRLAEMNGDLFLGAFTSGAALSATSLVDSDNLHQPDDHWNGGTLYVYEGDGKGYSYSITDFVNATKTLTITPGLKAAVAAADGYQIHRRLRQSDYKRFINQAIQDARHHALVPVIDESITLSSSTYEYDIPADIAYIRADGLRESTGTAAGVFDYVIPKSYWWINRGTTPRIVFDPAYWSPITSGGTLQIVGQKHQPELSADTDFCEINESFVIAKAAYYMHLAQSGGNSEEADYHRRQADAMLQEAELKRAELVGRPHPNSIPVRT